MMSLFLSPFKFCRLWYPRYPENSPAHHRRLPLCPSPWHNLFHHRPHSCQVNAVIRDFFCLHFYFFYATFPLQGLQSDNFDKAWGSLGGYDLCWLESRSRQAIEISHPDFCNKRRFGVHFYALFWKESKSLLFILDYLKYLARFHWHTLSTHRFVSEFFIIS